jgi:curved DNA-binding protein CbpA
VGGRFRGGGAVREPSEVGSLYDVLGVADAATDLELRRAYHRRARALHPDRHAGEPDDRRATAELGMRELNAAWEVLGDADRRSRYDAERAVRSRSGPPGCRPERRSDGVAPGYESVTAWMQAWGDVDAADAQLGRRHHGDDEDLDDALGSVSVPVWVHRVTVLLIGAIVAALLVGSAFASRVSDVEPPERGRAASGGEE